MSSSAPLTSRRRHASTRRNLGDGRAAAGLEAGAFRLYVEPGPAHGAVFEFHVPDLALARTALLAAGCVILEEDAAVPRCYVRDPYGLTFNLAQRAAR